jgi:predicted DNA-binding transcriptional regulator YafY
MSKSQRWFQLIDEVSVRPGQTARQLAERFERSERTIQRDIDDLKEIGIVILSENGYRFLTKPFLQPLALNREEVVAIMLAQQLAQRQLDPKAGEALSRAVDKMKRGMGGPEKRTADGVERNTAVVTSGATESDVTPTLLTELTQAVQERLEVELSYQGRDDQAPEQRHVEPLGLSFQEGRWYLHGFDLRKNGDRTFRLGRIKSLKVSQRRFVPKSAFSAEKATFHQWDLGEGEPVELTMTVSAGLARWFDENKPHPTVKVVGTTVTLSVNDPDAYLRWFASLDDAELVSPTACRERLHDRLENLRTVYQS